MANGNKKIEGFNTDLPNNVKDSFTVEFTGTAVQQIKKLQQYLNFKDEEDVVNYAITLLIKAEEEKSSIAIIDSNSKITYSKDLS